MDREQKKEKPIAGIYVMCPSTWSSFVAPRTRVVESDLRIL